MNKTHFGPSKLWRLINFAYITKSQAKNMANFKSNSVNFKLALFDPNSNGMRYLKTLINYLCESMSQEDWERIKKIKNRNLYNPITIRRNNEDICMDYLQATYELGFLDKYLKMSEIEYILEIGAGYGRTCHAILCNHNIKEYYIVDLDNCLKLSYNYLKSVLDDTQFAKIHFVSINSINLISKLNFDLCINIDSFSEMKLETVRHYLSYIDKHCKHLYAKNPVCNNIVRPLDKSLSWKAAISTRIYNAVGSALFVDKTALAQVIDIFDDNEVKKQVRKYIEIYRPGSQWKCISDAWAMPWSNYWQVIYSKS